MTKRLFALFLAVALTIGLIGCASSGSGYGRPRVSYSVGFGNYYGRSPWHSRPPIIIGGGGGIPDIPDGPVAEPMPDFGMPDMGPIADFGDF